MSDEQAANLRERIERGELIPPFEYGLLLDLLNERERLIEENRVFRMSVRALGEEVNLLAAPECALCHGPVPECEAEVGATGLLYHPHCYREVTREPR